MSPILTRLTIVRGCLILCLAVILGAQLKPGLEGLDGVYRYKFQNALMNGKRYESENRLTLFKVTDTSAYFNTHLEWANGHTCDLSGIGDLNATGVLIYKKPSIDGQTCTFGIKARSSGLVFSDESGACRVVSCGARGMLEGVEFKLKNRHKLNASQIRKSEEFRNAVAEQSRREPER